MGGLLLWDLWVTVWPVIKKPPDAGFAIPFCSLDLALDAVLPAYRFVALVKYFDFGSYLKKIYDYLGRINIVYNKRYCKNNGFGASNNIKVSQRGECSSRK